MQRLNIILVIFLFHSCNGKGQANKGKDKVVPESSVGYSIKLDDGKLVIKNSDSVLVYNSKNLIRNFDLLNTSFYKGTTKNDFFLVYQNDASVMKTQSTYHYYLSQNNLFLISKEEVTFNGKDIYISKNYVVPINAMNLDYEAADEKTAYYNNKNSIISKSKLQNNVFFNNKNAFELSFNYNPQDFFINYPVNSFKIGHMKIVDIKNSNDIAYYLSEANLYDESIFILKEIVQKFPDRVVAYLNLGDSYWSAGNKERAKEAYMKYISLMKSQNKDITKIPERVFQRSR